MSIELNNFTGLNPFKKINLTLKENGRNDKTNSQMPGDDPVSVSLSSEALDLLQSTLNLINLIKSVLEQKREIIKKIIEAVTGGKIEDAKSGKIRKTMEQLSQQLKLAISILENASPETAEVQLKKVSAILSDVLSPLNGDPVILGLMKNNSNVNGFIADLSSRIQDFLASIENEIEKA